MTNVTDNVVKKVESAMRGVSIDDPSMDTAIEINKFKDSVSEED